MYLQNGGGFDLQIIEKEIADLELQIQHEGFWQDRSKAEHVIKQLNSRKNWISGWNTLRKGIEDTKVLYTLAMELNDEGSLKETEKEYTALQQQYNQLRIRTLFSGEVDINNVYLTIHTGAGGTESCDWVQMLLRLYTRWCDEHHFKVMFIDQQDAEGGVKSVSIQVDGEYAYGYLHAETGVHRLVRISPFDRSSRRHTTFASVYVSPIIEDDIIINITPEDIRVDTYRSSGAGGQHVNKTDSAVRITHLETGIVVQCQNERSQIKNRSTAMKVLKSRLYQHYEQAKQKEQAKNIAEKKDIAWGSQIRSYVFHPYNMVKDHRTGAETGNIQGVMDGKIDMFIEAYLNSKGNTYKDA